MRCSAIRIESQIITMNKDKDQIIHGYRKDFQGTPVFYTWKAGDASLELPLVDPSLRDRGGSLKALVKGMGMPIHLLPDVKDFKVKVNKMDWLYELFGIEKREEPSISYEPYRNRKLNRYLVNQMLRLDKCRRNPALYWRVAKRLMKSTAFVVSSIQHVAPG